MSRVRRDHARCCIATWIHVCGHTRDIVLYSRFHQNPLRGFGATVGQILSFPITVAIGFYNSLYCRTSRDWIYNSIIEPDRCLYVTYNHTQQRTTSCRTGCNNTAGCTTGWVHYANEPSQAALERSSQDAYDVIRLTRSKAAVLTVDNLARLMGFV